MGMITGLVGIALVSGGTVAFFSDAVNTDNKILSGTLDLDVSDNDDGVLFEFYNKKPGDKFDYSFDLINAGTLDMKEVTLYSNHEIWNRAGSKDNNGFDQQIKLNKIQVDGKNLLDAAITLNKLKNQPIVLVESMKAETPAVQVYVEFEFIRTEKDQNKYQGNTMDLQWTFEAIQEDE